MGYRASVYMRDKNGEYNVPVCNEYGKTKPTYMGRTLARELRNRRP